MSSTSRGGGIVTGSGRGSWCVRSVACALESCCAHGSWLMLASGWSVVLASLWGLGDRQASVAIIR
eukprot:295976-Alexandrium_andersonii.AAC.1